MNMNNEIVIRSVYGKVGQIYYIQPCPNPKTGRLPDCVKPVKGDLINGITEMILSESDITAMSNGEKHFIAADHVFKIIDGTRFDLSDVVDKANWEAIEHCNWIAKDRFQRDAKGDLVIDGNAKRYGIAELYVDRPGEMAKAKVNKKELRYRAERFIFEDTEKERIKKARVLGRDLKNAIPADVLEYLLDLAEKKPLKIIEVYEGEDWKMHLFILDAIDRNVIRKSQGLYRYDDVMLGGTIESAIILLRDIKHKKLLDSIKRETYPEMLTNREIDVIKDTQFEGIPHFEDPTKAEKTKASTSKK